MSESKDAVLEAFNTYYKLKEEYEIKYRKKKNRILNNPSLSKKEKIRQFKQLKQVCSNCGRSGGIIFSDQNNLLSAICGNEQNPCSLNIEIQREPVFSLGSLDSVSKDELNEIHKRIIITKLNLLFNYTEEPEAIEQFNELKIELDRYARFSEDINKRYLDVVLNKMERERLNEENINLYIAIQKFKQNIQKYMKEEKVGFMKEALDIYLSEIRPIVEKIHKLKYKYSAVEKDNGINKLVEDPYTIGSLEFGRIGFVISNKK
jgi:hypothetical protein